MDWDELVKEEPRLRGVENYIRGWRKGCRRNGRMNLPTRTWKKRDDIENRLTFLVGRKAANAKLRGWECEHVAFVHLDKVLHHNIREELYFENGKYITKDMRGFITCRRCGWPLPECECGYE